MKVTCVAVLVSLLFLFELSVSAPSCGDDGVQDSFYPKYCSCFSGYAPTTASQSDCGYSALCPPRPSTDTRTKLGSYPPTLASANVTNDRLTINIRIPIVSGRLNATARLQGGESSCGYPGILWTKTTNQKDCRDELHASMPWSANSMCGFTVYKTTTKQIYSAHIAVSYDDIISDASGSFIRTSSVVLNLNVTFTTQASIIFALIDLTPGATLVTVSIVGNVAYDANTGLATVTIRSSATWPYYVASLKMFSTPYPNTAGISTDVFYNTAATCTNVTNTACLQQFIMQIAPNSGCNLGGSYVFNVTLGCRLAACAGTIVSGSYSVLIYATDICGAGGVDVSLANGALLAFSDNQGTAASTFVPNQQVFFQFSVTSSAVTIDAVTVQQISAADTSGNQDVLYDANAATPGATTAGTAASLVITAASTPVTPGTPAVLGFSLRLIDAIASFRVLPTSAATVTMTIIVNLQYHGNTRRLVLETNSLTASTGATDLYISTTATNNPNGVGGDLSITDAAATTTPSILFSVFAMLMIMITVW